MNNTIDPKEIEKFTAMADEWWSETGKFKPLHKFNPIRISYVREKIIQYLSLADLENTPLKNIKILDVGCGGGLLSEPFARLGADIVGLDAGEKNIKIAKIHAEKSGLKIDYRFGDVEELAKTDEKFDVVLAMEIIEHVADAEKFVEALRKCLKPNGILFIATINRTAKSYLEAIIGAEYIMRWLPRGTHDWKKFLKPSQINKIAAAQDLKLKEMSGFCYNLIKDEWKRTDNLDVNYVMIFSK